MFLKSLVIAGPWIYCLGDILHFSNTHATPIGANLLPQKSGIWGKFSVESAAIWFLGAIVGNPLAPSWNPGISERWTSLWRQQFSVSQDPKIKKCRVESQKRLTKSSAYYIFVCEKITGIQICLVYRPKTIRANHPWLCTLSSRSRIRSLTLRLANGHILQQNPG
jgi:hypothetical protein